MDETPLRHRVIPALRSLGLLQERAPLLVAVSGGPDSLALLSILGALRQQYPLRLHVAHLNHGLRGPEAEEDARYVQEVSSRLGVPLTIESADVGSFRLRHRLSWEAAAREVRYSFLSRTAKAVGASVVALGHTADDQAETVLLHLLRGTGLQGLRGMLPFSRWRSSDGFQKIALARPLLEVTRRETEAFCLASGLTPRYDSSNLEDRFTRNRIRRELIPLLKQHNPSIQKALVRLAQTVSRDLAYIDEAVQEAWPGIVSAEPWGLRLRRDAFLALHPSLQAHLLRRAWEELKGETAGLTFVHMEGMLELTKKAAGGSLSLGRELRFYTGRQDLLLATAAPSTPGPPLEETALPIPGEACTGGWSFTARPLDAPAQLTNGDPYRACLDLAALGQRAKVRSRRDGDRFQPLGMDGTKKLKEFMIDAHIPRHWRDSVPLLVGEKGVAWVIGWRIAHWARVTETTQQIVEIAFRREG